ncbi:MAG: DUF4112 domain-containing protein [Alphaproteobacteria bacterium]
MSEIRSYTSSLQDLETLADWMDSRFSIPGTNIRFGMDSLLGLVPGLGDTATAFITFYIIREAHRMGVPRQVKVRMGWNMFLDWLIGLIPLVGDLFDIGWKANRRNVALLRKHGKFP